MQRAPGILGLALSAVVASPAARLLLSLSYSDRPHERALLIRIDAAQSDRHDADTPENARPAKQFDRSLDECAGRLRQSNSRIGRHVGVIASLGRANNNALLYRQRGHVA